MPRNTTFGEIFVRFVEHVNKEGKGLVQISLRGGPGRHPDLRAGQRGCAPAWSTWCPSRSTLLYQRLPGVRRADPAAADDAAAAQDAVLDARCRSTPTRRSTRRSSRAYGDGVGFHIWTSKPPVNGSLKGMRLRTTPNYTPLFTTLGVSLVTDRARRSADRAGARRGRRLRLAGDRHVRHGLGRAHQVPHRPRLLQRDRQRAGQPRQVEVAAPRTSAPSSTRWLAGSKTENVRWVAERKAADDRRSRKPASRSSTSARRTASSPTTPTGSSL